MWLRYGKARVASLKCLGDGGRRRVHRRVIMSKTKAFALMCKTLVGRAIGVHERTELTSHV